MQLIDVLHAAISAENAPTGVLATNFEDAARTHEEMGGHLLEIRSGQDVAYLVTDSTRSVEGVEATVWEHIPEGETYDPHPSARWIVRYGEAFCEEGQ